MHVTDIPFGTTDWSSVPSVRWEGTSGLAYWRTVQFGGIRVRMVEDTPGYVADHWCTKGTYPFVSRGRATHGAHRWPSLRADAGYELPGRGRHRAASLLNKRRSEAVHSGLRQSPSGSLRRPTNRARRHRSRSPARSESRPSSQPAILGSRRATATPPCRPTTRPCRAGKRIRLTRAQAPRPRRCLADTSRPRRGTVSRCGSSR